MFGHTLKIPATYRNFLGATKTMLRRASSFPLPSRLGAWPVLKTVNKFAPLACRGYSSASPSITDLSSTSVTVENTTSPKVLTPQEKLVFGHTFTGKPCFCSALRDSDHMLTIEWTAARGWSPARIIPYQNLSLDPATCVLHYAFTCFEGMKAYKVCRV